MFMYNFEPRRVYSLKTADCVFSLINLKYNHITICIIDVYYNELSIFFMKAWTEQMSIDRGGIKFVYILDRAMENDYLEKPPLSLDERPTSVLS